MKGNTLNILSVQSVTNI